MTNLNDNAMTALSSVQAAQNIMEKLFDDGALGYLPHDSTYDPLRSMNAQMATVQATLESAFIGEDVMLLV